MLRPARQRHQTRLLCVESRKAGAPLRRWQAKGSLWLSDVRMVLVAAAAAGADGLTAFDIPLAYVNHDQFNQPVFGCNHLSGITAGTASASHEPFHHRPTWWIENACRFI